jgi:hypothetical protein
MESRNRKDVTSGIMAFITRARRQYPLERRVDARFKTIYNDIRKYKYPISKLDLIKLDIRSSLQEFKAKPDKDALIGATALATALGVKGQRPYNWTGMGCPFTDLNGGEGSRNIRFKLSEVQAWLKSREKQHALNDVARKERKKDKRARPEQPEGKNGSISNREVYASIFGTHQHYDPTDYYGNPGKHSSYTTQEQNAHWLASRGQPINSISLPGVNKLYETLIQINHPDTHKLTIIEGDKKRIDIVRENFKGTNADIIHSRLDNGEFKDSQISWPELCRDANFVWLDFMTRLQDKTIATIDAFFNNCKCDYFSFSITLGPRPGGNQTADHDNQHVALRECITGACKRNKLKVAVSWSGEYQSDTGTMMIFASYRICTSTVYKVEKARVKAEQLALKEAERQEL